MKTQDAHGKKNAAPQRFRRLSIIASVLAITMIGFGGAGRAEEPVTTVTFWDFTEHAAGLTEELVAQFNETIGKEKGVQIEFSNPGRNYEQAFNSALESGNPPDIFLGMGGRLDMPTLVEGQHVLALEDIPGGKEFLAQYAPQDLFIPGTHTYRGKTYSVPSYFFTIKLIYNKELFVKAGIVDADGKAKPPVTWAEAREDAQKITQLQPGETFGFVFPMKGAQTGTAFIYFWLWKFIRPFIPSIGHDYFDHQQGKYHFSDFRPALEFLLSLKQDGSVVPNELTMSDDAARIQFGQAGNVGMYIGASWDTGVLGHTYPATIDWGVAELPVFDPAKAFKNVAVAREGAYISAQAAQKDLANVFEVYKYLHSDAWQIRMYEEATFIPSMPRMKALAAKQSQEKGWAEFANVEHTIPALPVPDSLLTIEGDVWDNVLQMIYNGQVNMDEALADLDQRYNAAYQQAIADGKVNPDDYYYPTYDLRLTP